MNYALPFPEEVLLAEEDQNAEEKSPLDGAWYKRKQNNPGKKSVAGLLHTNVAYYMDVFGCNLKTWILKSLSNVC